MEIQNKNNSFLFHLLLFYYLNCRNINNVTETANVNITKYYSMLTYYKYRKMCLLKFIHFI